jgi:hypothetical protein
MTDSGNRPLLDQQPSQTRFNESNKMEQQEKRKKRVLIVGAGAAGETAQEDEP